MKLTNSEINKYCKEILKQVELRLDSIIEIAVVNEDFITFYSEWISQLGFEQTNDQKELVLDSDDEK